MADKRIERVEGELPTAFREWRKELAKTSGVPAYVILHDTTIAALCELRPRTMEELLTVPGIGEKKAERFGRQILEILGE